MFAWVSVSNKSKSVSNHSISHKYISYESNVNPNWIKFWYCAYQE